MADVIQLFTEAIFQHWQLLLIIILGFFSIIPWLGLFAINYFNRNIWREIRATVDRKTVKIVRILQNGQSQTLYRNMNPDRSMTLNKGQNGIDEKIIPTTAPHPDADSHRQVYFAVEGQEGTKNLLADSKYDVNSPQKTMTYSMAFEAGVEYEKALANRVEKFNYTGAIVVSIPIVLMILVLILIFNNQTILSAIAEAVGAKIGG